MNIRRNVTDDLVEMRLAGRLDGYWAPQLATEIEGLIRDGYNRIRLDLADLQYLSSAGIQVLVRYYRELAKIEGSLDLARPSDQVRKVLGLSGLQLLLARTDQAVTIRPRHLEVSGTRFDASVSKGGASRQCRVRGLDHRGSASLNCWRDTLAIGFGAFSVPGAEEQFGPFFAAGGASVCLPLDAGVPDFMITSEAFVPEMRVKSCIVSDGFFASRADFMGAPAVAGTLASAALEMVGADFATLVAVGQNENLQNYVLAVGVVARKASSVLGPMIQSLSAERWPAGSFCACIFNESGWNVAPEKELDSAIADLFTHRTPEALLTGGLASQVRFDSGTLWASPITSVTFESEG